MQSGNKIHIKKCPVCKEPIDKCICICTEKLFARTENSLVEAMMSIIRHDSEKRKAMLQFALSHMTKETTFIALKITWTRFLQSFSTWIKKLKYCKTYHGKKI